MVLVLLSLIEGEAGDAIFVPPEVLEKREEGLGDWAPVGSKFGQPKAGPWEFLGPRPIYGESWSDGTVSGRVVYILPHPTDENIIYIAAAQGGVWRTTDGGQTWEPLTDELPSISSGALAFEPGNPNVIYYGTGEMHFCGDCSSGDGLFKSTDGGLTWTKIAGRDEVGYYISKIYVHPNDPNVILVASNRGVVRSTDGGQTWQVVLSGSWVSDLVARPDDPDVIYAGMLFYGIYRSTDGGQTWTRLSNGLPAQNQFTRVQIAIAPSDPDVMYASFTDTDWMSLEGFYYSNDGGASWTRRNGTPDYLYPQGFYDHTIAVDPFDSRVVYAGGVYPYNFFYHGLMKSTNAGITWSDITVGSSGTLHPDIHFLAFDAAGDLWVGCDGGVWESTDGGNSWINHNADLEVTQFYTVAVSYTDPDIVQGGSQDNGTPRTEGTLDWDELSGGDGGSTAFLWDQPSISFTSYVYLDPLYKFNGTTYLGQVTGPWSSSNDRASWANAPLVVDPVDPQTVYAGTYRVYKTTDGGANWSLISGDLTNGTDGYLLALAVAASNNRVIYTCSSDGRLYVTTNGGGSWTLRSPAAWIDNTEIKDIAVDPNDAQRVYVALGSAAQVWMSTDGGQTWSDVSGNLSSFDPRYIFSLEVDFGVTPPVLYVGTKRGVYASFDGGSTWSRLDGLPYLDVYELYFNPNTKYLYAATHGRGMWRKDVSALYQLAKEKGGAKPRFWVFYSGGMLRYQLPKPGFASVFDITGRLLWSERVEARGQVKLDLKPGVYLFKAGTWAEKFVVNP